MCARVRLDVHPRLAERADLIPAHEQEIGKRAVHLPRPRHTRYLAELVDEPREVEAMMRIDEPEDLTNYAREIAETDEDRKRLLNGQRSLCGATQAIAH